MRYFVLVLEDDDPDLARLAALPYYEGERFEAPESLNSDGFVTADRRSHWRIERTWLDEFIKRLQEAAGAS